VTPEEIVREAMAAFGRRDLARMLSYLDDEVVVEMPYEARHGLAVLDKTGFRETLENVLALYERFEIEFERCFALRDVDGVVAEYRSDGVLAGSGVSYRNRYCGVFLCANDKVVHWREYDNPLVVDEAMAAHARAGIS